LNAPSLAKPKPVKPVFDSGLMIIGKLLSNQSKSLNMHPEVESRLDD
jgi:hypothetical protein